MKKLLLSLMCGVMAMTAAADTYTHRFATGEVTTDGGSVTLGGVEWTTTAADYVGFDNTNGKGLQIGSAKKPSSSWSISTSAFSEVTSVVINAATATGGKAEVTVTVGDSEYGPEEVERDLKELTYTTAGESGKLTITLANAGETAKAMYVESIIVTYNGGEPVTPTPGPTPSGDPLTELNTTFEGVTSISQLTGWSSVTVKGDKNWYFTSYDNNSYAAMTGFKGTSTEGYEAWLITPALNVDGMAQKVLSFATQAAYSGDDKLEVFAMSSADPTSANLTALIGVIAEPPASGYSGFINSGEISLAQLSGEIYIGFRYTAPAGQTGFRTYCVDNVVAGGKGSDPTPGPGTTPDPSEAKVITVTEALALGNTGEKVWVVGYIVGSAPGQAASSFTTVSGDEASTTNIFLAATASETDYQKCIPVQLPAGDVRTGLNLQQNPDNLGQGVKVYGSLEKYFSQTGVKSTSAYELGVEVPDAPNPGPTPTPSGDVLTVTEALALGSSTDKVWVVGYIVGSAPGKGADSFTTVSGDEASATNIFIAATASETDYQKCMPVQLPAGDVRTGLNLVNNPDNLGQGVKVYGSLEKYFSQTGVKNTSAYELGVEVPDAPVGPDPVDPSEPVNSINEPFNVNSISQLAGWSVVTLKGVKSWYTKTFSGNTYAAMSGYNGTSTEGYESWLITPAINSAAMPKMLLTFETQAAYSGDDQLEVFLMTGSADPSTAALKLLDCAIAESPESGYSDWVNSGNITVTTDAPVCYIGFRYTAPEGQSGYVTYCLDNVKLDADNSSLDTITVDSAAAAQPIYDLQGRRVMRPATHGIYIVGGRKVVL